ncbi:GIY-YIG nuclease family protein [Pseudotenacibaculum haliotis]|uniref:GIY-YIG nuclease family protein n=2 Tax=Pseudotenacibaculum haliotis TaxID=1862138 RepID=A0ABW5LTV1_9FLAO
MKDCVYILFSKKLNRFYTGQTSNFEQRMEFHKSAENTKFTGKADDWQLFLKINCQSKKQALAIETHIKKMKSSTYIKNLIKYPEIIDKLKVKYNC